MCPYKPISDQALGGGGGDREERQRHWIPKRQSQFPNPTRDQAVPRYDPKWDPENDKDE
jgi:hypothetical protein